VALGATQGVSKLPAEWVGPTPDVPGATRSTSSNWAGYVDVGRSGSFTDVRASWIEPSISCSPSLSPKNDDSFRIGLDGVTTTSKTVEQTGTEGICKGTTVRYDAWYEMYPKYAVWALPVDAGDQISAEVAWVGGMKFVLTLTDTTSGRRLHKTPSAPLKAVRSSAEWVAENPAECNNYLENFGTVTFSDASATKNGITGGIGAFANQAITMIAHNHGVMSQPSALGGNGSSFSVAWRSS
jgi:hypothetical protein